MLRWALRIATLTWIGVHGTGCPTRKPVSGDEGPSAPQGRPATSRAASQQGDAANPGAFSERGAERHALVHATMETRDIEDPRVLDALRRVPRHRFVPASASHAAYTDQPLPIGHGQTISQPYIVAFMTQAAHPQTSDKCLEIGTGSGYQAAVLAELCREVYSIEYLRPVAEFGAANLRAVGYTEDKVKLRVGDGYLGWPEAAPFDVILVTAAPPRVPPQLLEQLSVGGRLVIPVGTAEDGQELERWTKAAPRGGKASYRTERLLSVRFVPFLGRGAE